MTRHERMFRAMLATVMLVAVELLTVEEVAAELKLGVETIRRYLRSGEIKGFRINRQAGWRVERTELERFINSRRTDD